MPPKKMSLQEFFHDESLGSWADDDFDISSISVPIRHTSASTTSNAGYHSRFAQQVSPSSGPPYIAKLTNLPMSATPTLLKDLFESRYMKYEKCKILIDPNPPIPRFSSQKSERKCCFVQLASHQELNKVLKWNNIFIDRLSVMFSPADFQDFQDVQTYNSQIGFDDVEDEKRLNERGGGKNGFGSGKPVPSRREGGMEEPRKEPVRHPKPNPFGNAKPVNVNDKVVKEIKKPTILKKEPLVDKPAETAEETIADKTLVKEPTKEQVKEAPKKINPFGAAKPVDVLSKQREIEKKLKKLAINQTTYVLGHSDQSKESLVSGASASKTESSNTDKISKAEKPLGSEKRSGPEKPNNKAGSEKLPETEKPRKSRSPESEATKKSSQVEDNPSEVRQQKKNLKRGKKQPEDKKDYLQTDEVKVNKEEKKEVTKKSQKPKRWEHKQQSQENVASSKTENHSNQSSKSSKPHTKVQREQVSKPLNQPRPKTDGEKLHFSKGEGDAKKRNESDNNRDIPNEKPKSAVSSAADKKPENGTSKPARGRGSKNRQKVFANMHYVRKSQDEN